MVSERAQKFNDYLAQSAELQKDLINITSAVDLVKLAEKKGFTLTIVDFQELARQAYQQWLHSLNSATRLFFEEVHQNPQLNQKLHQCNNFADLINLANDCGIKLTNSDLEQASEIANSIRGFSLEKLFFQNLSGVN